MSIELVKEQPITQLSIGSDIHISDLIADRTGNVRTFFALEQGDAVIERATRRAQVAVRGRKTISRDLTKHIAGFAFEELVADLFATVSGGLAQREDTAADKPCITHDISLGSTRFEIKCRHGVRDDARTARAKDFDVKVNQYNEAWQKPDYYVFGYCFTRRDHWYFDILGYQLADFVKQEANLMHRGADRANGHGGAATFNAPAYVVRISQLRPPAQLIEHIYGLANQIETVTSATTMPGPVR